jgi:hypothetical protein
LEFILELPQRAILPPERERKPTVTFESEDKGPIPKSSANNRSAKAYLPVFATQLSSNVEAASILENIDVS